MKYIYTLSILLCANTIQAEFPVSVSDALETSAKEFEIPSRMLKALCFVESSHNPKAINKIDGGSASHGLCQLKIKTAKYLGYSGNIRSLYNPYVNSYYAAKYLRYQLDRYNGNWVKAISAYNAGHAYRKINNMAYVKKVMKSAKRYD